MTIVDDKSVRRLAQYLQQPQEKLVVVVTAGGCSWDVCGQANKYLTAEDATLLAGRKRQIAIYTQRSRAANNKVRTKRTNEQTKQTREKDKAVAHQHLNNKGLATTRNPCDSESHRHRHRRTERQTDIQSVSQSVRQTDRQIDIQVHGHGVHVLEAALTLTHTHALSLKLELDDGSGNDDDGGG